MAFEKEVEQLTLERKRSVNQIAKAWGDTSLLLSPETARAERERPGLTGARLITKLHGDAKDLCGRVVGRNKDDARSIFKGLEVLEKEWELLEHCLHKAQQDAQQARVGRSYDATQGLSSPDSADSHYIHKQHQRIQQLEEQEKRVQEELKQLKAKWESIMAKILEQQASVHRQQMQEREAIVAQKEAEIEQLRRRIPEPKAPAEPRREGPSQGNPLRGNDQFKMTGRAVIGQTLQIVGPLDKIAPEGIKWFRIKGPGSWHLISGAGRSQYSPEPYDVGFPLGCSISPIDSPSPKDVIRISSTQPVASLQGFEESIEALVAKGGADFGVVIVQKNGMLHTNRELCTLEVSGMHVALRLPNTEYPLQAPYNAGMQVCGARGAGDAAVQGVFLALRPNQAFMLVCESAQKRNTCILLIRRVRHFLNDHLDKEWHGEERREA